VPEEPKSSTNSTASWEEKEEKKNQHHHTTTEQETMNAILLSYRKSPSTLQSYVTEHTWSLTLQM
jgi:ribosomal protein S18